MKTIFFLIFTVIFSNIQSISESSDSYLCLIEFKENKIELDSNEVMVLEGLISSIKKDQEFCRNYEILFTPYNYKSEFLLDKNIGFKRFNYLKKIIHFKINKECRLVFMNSKKFSGESVKKSKTGLIYYINYLN